MGSLTFWIVVVCIGYLWYSFRDSQPTSVVDLLGRAGKERSETGDLYWDEGESNTPEQMIYGSEDWLSPSKKNSGEEPG